MIKDAQANLTIWDFLKIVVPDMSFQMFKKMKDAIHMTPKLREDIVRCYKNFQLNMTTLYENEEDIEQQNEKIYKPVLAAIAMRRKKAYMDSDIFYFDVGERNRDDIIHASPYGIYFKNEFGIYEN